MCSKRNDHTKIIDIMSVKGYKDWFQRKKENDKNKIRECVYTNLVHSMRLMICCEDVSMKILETIFSIFCSQRNQRDYGNFECMILEYINRPKIKKQIFDIIERSQICDDKCPMHLTTRERHRISKRQFDMASTIDNIEQLVCSDTLDVSVGDLWSDMLTCLTYQNEDEKMIDMVMYMSLVRKPSCCLVLHLLEGD